MTEEHLVLGDMASSLTPHMIQTKLGTKFSPNLKSISCVVLVCNEH